MTHRQPAYQCPHAPPSRAPKVQFQNRTLGLLLKPAPPAPPPSCIFPLLLTGLHPPGSEAQILEAASIHLVSSISTRNLSHTCRLQFQNTPRTHLLITPILHLPPSFSSLTSNLPPRVLLNSPPTSPAIPPGPAQSSRPRSPGAAHGLFSLAATRRRP